MKKNYVFLFVLAAGLLVISCGKSRKPEVKEAAKIASEGIFGSIGEDLVYFLNDKTVIREEYKEKMEKLDAEYGSKKDMTEEKYNEAGKKMLELDEEKKAKLEKWDKDSESFSERLIGIEVATEVAENVPMKVIKPFTVTKATFSGNLIFEATVELTADRPVIEPKYYCTDTEFMPRVVPIDANGESVTTDRPKVVSCSEIHDRKQHLKAGQQVVLKHFIIMNESISGLLVKSLQAKKLQIIWDKPFGDVNQPISAATHEETIDEGMEDYDDQFDGVGQEGLLGSIPQGTTVYEGDMAGFPIVFTIIRNDNEGGLKATYKNVKYGSTMNLIGESLPAMGGDISFLCSTNDGDWSFDLTGNAEEITGTASGDGKNLKVRLHRKK